MHDVCDENGDENGDDVYSHDYFLHDGDDGENRYEGFFFVHYLRLGSEHLSGGNGFSYHRRERLRRARLHTPEDASGARTFGGNMTVNPLFLMW